MMPKNRARDGNTLIQYVIYVRRQEGSSGWRRAQDREVIRGCAAEVIGLIEVRVGGRVSDFGKRIGETNGLNMSVMVAKT